MKIGLADCNLASSVGGNYHMPLGLLTIGGMTESFGHEVELLQILDLSPKYDKLDYYIQRFASLIAEKRFDLVGFTTRCDTLPIVLEVARRLKLQHKNVPITLGGPGATFVDRQLLKIFPFLNIIVRGEGEITFAELLEAFEGQKDLLGIDGISFRDHKGKVVTTKKRSPITDFDSLPPIPLHLIDHVLSKPELISTDILIGRGCPNGCSFCSTCAFWGKRIRKRSPGRIVSEMKVLRDKYGITHFNLIDDNLVSHRKLGDLCELIKEELPGVKLWIFASLNFVTADRVKMLADCGCYGALVGLETGSERLAFHIPRKFCKPQDIFEKLNIFHRNNIRTVKTFIVGFPDETADDISKTLMLAIEAQARSPISFIERTDIFSLTINPGTKLYDKYHHQLSFSPTNSRFGLPNLVSDNTIRSICKEHPEIFTVYSKHMSAQDYAELVELSGMFQLLISYFPKTLFVLLSELELTPIEFFHHFRDYLSTLDSNTNTVIHGGFRLAYLEFFTEFLAKLYRDVNYSQEQVHFFLQAEKPRIETLVNKYEAIKLCSPNIFLHGIFMNMTPVLPRTTQLLSLSYDPDVLFSQFLENGSIMDLPSDFHLDLICYIPRKYVSHSSMLGLNVVKPNELTDYIIKHVDGSSTCSEIANKITNIVEAPQKQILYNAIKKNFEKMMYSGILMLSGECS
jgi:radical SAM superfamily enzyme YgiQ (UPF0313 family)